MSNYSNQVINSKSQKNWDLFRLIRSIRIIIFFISFIYLFYSTCKPVHAVMSSSNFELQMPNLNMVGGGSTSPSFKLGYTGGQTANGPYSSTGFRVLAGFWYLKSIIPFSFSISNNTIEFGTLDPTLPKTESTLLTVSAGGAGGYQVTAEENHELMVYSTGAIIPDTTGDGGDITQTNASTWSQNSTYGFGYTLFGNDVPTPFPTAGPAGTQYKQFANTSKNETPEVIMTSVNRVGENRSATVTYKLNISATQAAGRYHNVITYIAIPTY